MKGRALRAIAAVFTLATLLLWITGCRDQTGTPENKALTERRQATIREHKSQDNN